MAKTDNPILDFISARKKDLRKIAHATKGEYTEHDLYGEAWVIATRIGEKRGRIVDLSNLDDQDLVLRWLYNEVVRYAEKNIRCAVRLDNDWDLDDSESAESKLASLIPPIVWPDQIGLIDSEEMQATLLNIVEFSYSQYSAYMILLNRFKWDVIVLAEHLNLLASTIKTRVLNCEAHMKRQPSIFDRIQAINHNFLPTLTMNVTRVESDHSGWEQIGLNFA